MESEKKTRVQEDASDHYGAAFIYNARRARLWFDALRDEDLPIELIEKLIVQWYVSVTQIDVHLALNSIAAAQQERHE